MSERLSFYQLFAEKGYSIVIPIIQRDYAQGRKSTKEIRDSFLDALFSYLEVGRPFRDLDFVYGDVDEQRQFIPLDGQQRLTTLFLLHWYLALKEDCIADFKNKLQSGGFSKFCYRTRQSSTDFCNALVKAKISLNELLEPDEGKANDLSKTIKDRHWYFLSWDRDPTIQSMLRMLDAIHEKFKSAKGFYEKLTNLEEPVITFQFLPLKDYGLTDDLYIKMNSRGKPLTKFENFKAKFEQHLSSPIYKTALYDLKIGEVFHKVDIKTYFAHQIDTKWADFFWPYRDKRENIFDKQIMNFISVLAINNTALHTNDVKHLIDQQGNLPIRFFSEQHPPFTTNLIAAFDLMSNRNDYLGKDSDFYYFKSEHELIKIINNDFNDAAYLERVQFYAYYAFLIKWKGDTQGFQDWMRVIVNLSTNTAPYNRDTEFVNSIRSIHDLLDKSNQIVEYLKETKPGEVRGFNPTQIKEERIKAHLLTKSKEWQKCILKYERHSYFQGQLTFALAFSGIEDYFDKYKNCEWSSEEGQDFLQKFTKYVDKVFALFSESGLRKQAKDAHRFHRAVLSKGDYLLYAKSNYSFLVDRDRDISWKRLFQGDGDRKEKRGFVKQVIDDPRYNPGNLTSLDLLVKDLGNNIPDWRKLFIQQSDLFYYLGNFKYIRFYETGETYLLKGIRTSGKHSELFSLSSYLNLKEELNPSPFQEVLYYSPSGESDSPCFYLTGWEYKDHRYELNIYYNYNNQFLMIFREESGKELIEEVQTLLVESNFCAKNNHFELSIKSSELKTALETLLDNLNPQT